MLLCYTMTSHIGFLHAEVVPGTLLIPVPLPGRLQATVRAEAAPRTLTISTPPHCSGAWMGARGAAGTAAPLQPTLTDP